MGMIEVGVQNWSRRRDKNPPRINSICTLKFEQLQFYLRTP